MKNKPRSVFGLQADCLFHLPLNLLSSKAGFKKFYSFFFAGGESQ